MVYWKKIKVLKIFMKRKKVRTTMSMSYISFLDKEYLALFYL